MKKTKEEILNSELEIKFDNLKEKTPKTEKFNNLFEKDLEDKENINIKELEKLNDEIMLIDKEKEKNSTLNEEDVFLNTNEKKKNKWFKKNKKMEENILESNNQENNILESNNQKNDILDDENENKLQLENEMQHSTNLEEKIPNEEKKKNKWFKKNKKTEENSNLDDEIEKQENDSIESEREENDLNTQQEQNENKTQQTTNLPNEEKKKNKWFKKKDFIETDKTETENKTQENNLNPINLEENNNLNDENELQHSTNLPNEEKKKNKWFKKNKKIEENILESNTQENDNLDDENEKQENDSIESEREENDLNTQQTEDENNSNPINLEEKNKTKSLREKNTKFIKESTTNNIDFFESIKLWVYQNTKLIDSNVTSNKLIENKEHQWILDQITKNLKYDKNSKTKDLFLKNHINYDIEKIENDENFNINVKQGSDLKWNKVKQEETEETINVNIAKISNETKILFDYSFIRNSTTLLELLKNNVNTIQYSNGLIDSYIQKAEQNIQSLTIMEKIEYFKKENYNELIQDLLIQNIQNNLNWGFNRNNFIYQYLTNWRNNKKIDFLEKDINSFFVSIDEIRQNNLLTYIENIQNMDIQSTNLFLKKSLTKLNLEEKEFWTQEIDKNFPFEIDKIKKIEEIDKLNHILLFKDLYDLIMFLTQHSFETLFSQNKDQDKELGIFKEEGENNLQVLQNLENKEFFFNGNIYPINFIETLMYIAQDFNRLNLPFFNKISFGFEDVILNFIQPEVGIERLLIPYKIDDVTNEKKTIFKNGLGNKGQLISFNKKDLRSLEIALEQYESFEPSWINLPNEQLVDLYHVLTQGEEFGLNQKTIRNLYSKLNTGRRGSVEENIEEIFEERNIPLNLLILNNYIYNPTISKNQYNLYKQIEKIREDEILEQKGKQLIKVKSKISLWFKILIILITTLGITSFANSFWTKTKINNENIEIIEHTGLGESKNKVFWNYKLNKLSLIRLFKDRGDKNFYVEENNGENTNEIRTIEIKKPLTRDEETQIYSLDEQHSITFSYTSRQKFYDIFNSKEYEFDDKLNVKLNIEDIFIVKNKEEDALITDSLGKRLPKIKLSALEQRSDGKITFFENIKNFNREGILKLFNKVTSEKTFTLPTIWNQFVEIDRNYQLKWEINEKEVKLIMKKKLYNSEKVVAIGEEKESILLRIPIENDTQINE